jgi:hypothetical protein
MRTKHVPRNWEAKTHVGYGKNQREILVEQKGSFCARSRVGKVEPSSKQECLLLEGTREQVEMLR